MRINISKKLSDLISNTLTIIVVLIALLLVGSRFIGYSPYAIIGGSMEPTYQVGDLVYVQKVDPKGITKNMPITYVLNAEGVVSTHRVVDIDIKNQQFITKGDANSSNDAVPVHFNNVIGVVKYSIPYLGYLSVYLNSRQGQLILILLLSALIGYSLISKVMQKSLNKKIK